MSHYPEISASQESNQQEPCCMIFYLGGKVNFRGWSGQAGKSFSPSNRNHQDMSNEANIDVSVPLPVVKSEFVVMQFIFLLPALWMLFADVSDKYFLRQNKSYLSSSSE